MKTIILTVTIAFASLTVQAQDKKEKIMQLFQIMQSDKLMDAIVDNMQNMTIRSRPMRDPAKDSIFNAFTKQELKAFHEKVMKPEMAAAYDRNFTEQEIDKYLAFYKSAEGKKMIDLMPVMHKELMENMSSKFMPAFMERTRKRLEELYPN